MSDHHRRVDSRQYRRQRAEFLAAHPVCLLCLHPGADQLDHIIPVSVAPQLARNPANWRPSHGVRKCQTCGQACNQQRGTKPVSAISPRSRRW